MEDKMAREASVDPLASYVRISERVEHQGRDLTDLRGNMNTGFTNMQGAIAALTNELRSSGKTQWPVIWSAIGVSFAVIGAVGALAYRPVLATQDRIETSLVRLTEAVVTKEDLAWQVGRDTEDRTRLQQQLDRLRDQLAEVQARQEPRQ